MTQVALSIGSNLGDRMLHLQNATTQLADQVGKVLAVASVYETEPVGGPEQSEYLNTAVVLETELTPLELLAVVNQIELAQGRTRDIHWGPRTIDIDIIDVVGFQNSTEQLTVPHPRAAQRAFVLVPLNEIAPDWQLGGTANVGSLLAAVSGQQILLRSDLKLVGVSA